MHSTVRTIVVPAAVAAAVLALSACASGSTSTAAPAASGTAPAASPSGSSSVPSSTASSSASKASAAQAPWADVALVRTSADGSRTVSVKVTVTGEVFGDLDAEGKAVPSATSEGHGSRIAWGDGAIDGSDPGDVRCAQTTPLVPLRRDLTLAHTFAKPGTYTFSFTQEGCGLTKPVTHTLTITVR